MGQIIQKAALGETVRDLAAEKGIPISVVERESGYSPGMISRWITAGGESGTLSKLVTMADLLGASLDELVGRQSNSFSKAPSSDPVSCLQAETVSGQLMWLQWSPDDNSPVSCPIPACDSGRPFCGGWWTERGQLKFLLVRFCEDMQDDDEELELYLYCTPGHKLPLYPVASKSLSALHNLYTQIILTAAFAPQEIS